MGNNNNEIVFAARNLCKKYNQSYVLNNSNMEIKWGDIYGLVGENGAGKTTLIRILAGLISQTSGEIFLSGENRKAFLSAKQRRIGSIIETPALYHNLTATNNLEICRLQIGGLGKSSVQDILSLVGLLGEGKKLVKHFSLGMKQHLRWSLHFRLFILPLVSLIVLPPLVYHHRL